MKSFLLVGLVAASLTSIYVQAEPGKPGVVTSETAMAAIAVQRACSAKHPQQGYTMDRMYTVIEKGNPGTDVSLIKQLNADPKINGELQGYMLPGVGDAAMCADFFK